MTLLEKLQKATKGSEALEAEIVAYMNSAIVKPYPPATDFGPQSHWQFWSEDGKHFLGNEAHPKFKILPWTRVVDAALTLRPEGVSIGMYIEPSGISCSWAYGKDGWRAHEIKAPTLALAVCIAIMEARMKMVEHENSLTA